MEVSGRTSMFGAAASSGWVVSVLFGFLVINGFKVKNNKIEELIIKWLFFSFVSFMVLAG